MDTKKVLILRIVLIAISFMICTNVWAKESAPQTFQFVDWSKGLSSYTNPYLIQNNQGVVFQNLRVGKEFGALTKRDPLLLYGTASAAQINGLHRFYQSDGTKQLLANYSTVLGLGDDDDGTFTQTQTGLTDEKIWQWVTYKDVAIGVNGTDNNIKFDGVTTITPNTDGSKTEFYLTAELGGSFAELNTGSNLDASSWYAYRIAYYDGTTYKYSTAISNKIKTGSTVQDVTLTGISLGSSGTTQRIIYRTEGKASVALLDTDVASNAFYRVATISDNSTTTYNDAVDDATLLGDSAPTWSTVSAGTNLTPPIGKYLIINDQRLFIAGNSSANSTIYWSTQYFPDIFDTSSDNREIRPDDGDKITGLSIVLGQLSIFKNNSLQKFFTEGADPDNDWSISDPYTTIGCIAPYSIANTPKGIIYLYWDGLYLFDGQYSSLLSEVVQDVIQDISKSNIENCYGHYNSNKFYLAYTSDSAGGTENNRVLLYDMLKDAYNIDIATINYFTSFLSGTDTNVLYGGDSSSNGKVWAYSAGADTLIVRLKSDFNLGTFDDSKVSGTEDAPVVDIAWGLTIDEWGTISATIDGFSGGGYIIDREDSDGTWTSPAYQVNASSLNKLYWNEALGSNGDITFQVRSGATASDAQAAAWSSSFTVPTGSDISGETANVFLQLRANLSTILQTESPTLFSDNSFVIKVDYLKSGAIDETEILSQWTSGWQDFNSPSYKKIILRIKVFYQGTSGNLTFNYINNEGDIDNSFDIDLSVLPGASLTDSYTGSGPNKIYTYRPLESETTKGQYFKFDIRDTGVTEWIVDRVELIYKRVEIYD